MDSPEPMSAACPEPKAGCVGDIRTVKVEWCTVHDQMHRTCEIADLETQLAQVTAERDKWQAHHEALKERNAVLKLELTHAQATGGRLREAAQRLVDTNQLSSATSATGTPMAAVPIGALNALRTALAELEAPPHG